MLDSEFISARKDDLLELRYERLGGVHRNHQNLMRTLGSDSGSEPEDAASDLMTCLAATHATGSVELIDEALDRIEAGTYGVCCGCKQLINEERLEYYPMAALCIDCQRLAEDAGYSG